MASVFDKLVSRIYSVFQQDGIDIISILPNIEILTFDELDNWLERAKIIFNENEEHKNLARILYAVWKVSLILNCEIFTPKDFRSALEIIYPLWEPYQSEIPEMISILFKHAEESIASSNSVKDIIEWWQTVERLAKIDKEKFNLLIQTIRGRLYFICTESINENPRNVLLFLTHLDKVSDKIDVNDLIKYAMELSLQKIEEEWSIYIKESYQFFKESMEELLNIIQNLKDNMHIRYDFTGTEEKLWKILGMLENSHNKLSPRNSDQKQCENCNQIETDQDIPLDRSQISQGSFLPFKYTDNSLEIMICQGVLQSGEKVCIKYFFVSSQKHFEIFKKEMELIKFLSGRHQCFLKYYGWFCVGSGSDQKYNAYAIVTEYFKRTLIEDIMYHSKNQIKYTLSWFLKIAKDLLEAFYYLEKSSIPHFDIRPHNILIADDNKLKISGFNFAKINLERISDNLLKEDEEIWIDSYAAPEVCDGQDYNIHEVTSVMKAGVFSLGLVFVQIYSLCKISELNTQEYYEKIDYYVSTFQPEIVAGLLKRMLKINKYKRWSFYRCLKYLLPKEERKENINQQNQKKILETIENTIKSLKKIDLSCLEIVNTDERFEQSEKGLKIIYQKAKYNTKDALIRTFKHINPEKLLPFLEEAKILEDLDGKHKSFIKYYGLEWNESEDELHYSLTLVTELCEDNLMADMTRTAQKGVPYAEEYLKYAFEYLLQGFAALKASGYDHDNISPHAILFNSYYDIKISGFITPENKIESWCIFPSQKLYMNEMNSYLSPEKLKSREEGGKYDIEQSDVYSLGLVFMQTQKVASVNSWNCEKYASDSQPIKYFWLDLLLKSMLRREPSERPNFNQTLKIMQDLIKKWSSTPSFMQAFQ